MKKRLARQYAIIFSRHALAVVAHGDKGNDSGHGNSHWSLDCRASITCSRSGVDVVSFRIVFHVAQSKESMCSVIRLARRVSWPAMFQSPVCAYASINGVYSTPLSGLRPDA